MPLKHEQRQQEYKEYMGKLTEKIDKNIGIYKNYHIRNHSVDFVQDGQANSFKDDIKLDNQRS